MTTYQIVNTVLPSHPSIIVVERNDAAEKVAEITSLSNWFDASPQFTTGDTAADFRWIDKIGEETVSVFNKDSGNRPVFTEVNGKPALAFGPPALPLTQAQGGALIADNALRIPPSYTIAMVANLEASAAGALVGTASPEGAFRMLFDSSGRVSVTQNPDEAFSIRPPTNFRSGTHLFLVTYNAQTQNMVLRVDGVVVGTASGVAPISADPLRLGAYGVTSSQAALQYASIAECIIFRSDLTNSTQTAALAAVEGYLKTKYAIS